MKIKKEASESVFTLYKDHYHQKMFGSMVCLCVMSAINQNLTGIIMGTTWLRGKPKELGNSIIREILSILQMR